MIVVPAIDLRGGRCVRLTQGEADSETRYDDDPVARAKAFESAGAQINCGNNDHTRAARTKLSRNFAPVTWLFSGWNCVPMILPTATTDANRSP